MCKRIILISVSRTECIVPLDDIISASLSFVSIQAVHFGSTMSSSVSFISVLPLSATLVHAELMQTGLSNWTNRLHLLL